MYVVERGVFSYVIEPESLKNDSPNCGDKTNIVESMFVLSPQLGESFFRLSGSIT